MYTVPQCPQAFTVFFYSGSRRTFNSIVKLVQEYWTVYARNSSNTRCRYAISHDFDLTCSRCCSPITNSDVGRRCIVEKIVGYDTTKHRVLVTHESHDRHILESCIIVRDRDTGRSFSEQQLVDLYYQVVGRKKRRNLDRYERYDEKRRLKKSRLVKRMGSDVVWHHCVRTVKTTNERRQYEAALVEDIKPKIRSKRNPNNLPNSWDDVHVSLISHAESWKTQRVRKQWMVKD